MKITSYNLNAINSYKNQQQNVKPTEKKASFADKLEISSAAKDLQVGSNYSAERTERVNQLKADIQSGEYKVDARKVAEDMLKYYRF